MRLTAGIAERLGASRTAAMLNRRNLLLRTRVADEVRRLIRTELLEQPGADGEPPAADNALSRAILAGPRVTERLQPQLAAIGARAEDPQFRARLRDAMRTYAGTRAAAAEIATGLTTLGGGALALNKLTPGAVSSGSGAPGRHRPAIRDRVVSARLGARRHLVRLFPAASSLALTAGLTGGLMLTAAGFAALAGVVTDPLQRRLGLHQRRLLCMLDALERQMLDPAAPSYAARDHYVARLMDLFDMLGCAYRLAHS